ncbi:MAG: HEPN domain-containing protein [Porphyromonadaceae bacterium]|nr:MAG: HEPN domain-containing protein [Porphyromonadaceae bacterium]
MNGQASEIERWIVKGDHDLGTAKITYLYIPEYLDTVTYHCQQAVEKYLKAYLIFHSISFRFSHDLVYLLDLIVQKDLDFNNYYDSVSELQGYAVEIRYPNETIFLSNEKVEKAMVIAKAIRELVTGKMNISIDYNDVIDK